jgi:hypothetical protein
VPAYTAPTEDDFPAAAYGPDGTLWLAWIAYHVVEEERRIEPPQLKEQPKDFKAYYTPDHGEQLLIKYLRNGKWSAPVALTGKKEDLMRCAVAVEGDGTVWVIYSANRNGKHNIHAQSVHPTYKADDKDNPVPRVGQEQQLTTGDHVDLSPVACTTGSGEVWVAFQRWDAARGNAVIHTTRRFKGVWEPAVPRAGSDPSRNDWYAAVAGGPGNRIAQAWDTYDGDYDIFVTELQGNPDAIGHNVAMAARPAAATSRFEARPSVCYDPQGRIWIAYEEGHEQWGKDFGPFDDQEGNPLYFGRTVKVVCIDNGKLLRPAAELPPLAERVRSPDTGQKVEAIPRYAYPRITIDGKGRIWITYRVKFGTRYSTHPGAYWLTFARMLNGDRWSEPIEIHHSDGLLDDRPVVLPHPAGGLRILHNTDGRYTTPERIDNQLYMSYVDLPSESGALAPGAAPVSPKLLPHDAGKKNPMLVERAKKEAGFVKRIRDYRIDAGGKKLMLLRGEFHRHTEISWDGGPDGSLEDMWRYGFDPAGFDWIGNGDHDLGAGREYSWWLTQKFTDAYHVKGHFTSMFTYERSASYPHGHRNCMFAKRGIRTLPRLAEPDPAKRVAGIHADDTKMLYRYLRELDGICAVHTSATGMGTDWRDNDPVVEPFVEIYQGLRMTNEYEGAPRAGFDPKTKMKPANIGGWQPLGFVNHALGKGHRLGFQASSDHHSTHISYTIVLAERNDREAILEACKKRHVYGATDNIIVDVRSGSHIMGDEFKSKESPSLDIRIIGTAPLAKVEVLKDSKVVHTFEPKQIEFTGRWTDPNAGPGVHYYYVRVQQADAEIAWSSPMWIDWTK